MLNTFFSRIIATSAFALAATGSANALKINLLDQGGVKGSKAEVGFKIAAAYWESVITNDVTLNFGVGYAALPKNVIGSTGSSGMDYRASDWEAGINATKSNSTLDQNLVMPTLTNGAVKAITSGYQVTSKTSACPSGNCGVDTTKQVWDADVGNGINSTNNKVLFLNTANVKAVGGTAVYSGDNTQHLDADITFSSDFGFDFNPSNGTNPNTFDFIGTAIHEMGHALGFVSGVDDYDFFGSPNGPCQHVCGTAPDLFDAKNFNFNSTSLFSALDMFRYSDDPNDVAPGKKAVLDESVGTDAYFSIDGGKSQLFGDSRFSTGAFNGDGNQASHWKDTDSCTIQLGIMDPTECFGQEDYVTALDLAAMDAIGWNLNIDVINNKAYEMTTRAFYARYLAEHPGAVPETSSWALMLAGFGLVGGAMRRRSVRVSYAR